MRGLGGLRSAPSTRRKSSNLPTTEYIGSRLRNDQDPRLMTVVTDTALRWQKSRDVVNLIAPGNIGACEAVTCMPGLPCRYYSCRPIVSSTRWGLGAATDLGVDTI